jgi:hypothetical protein
MVASSGQTPTISNTHLEHHPNSLWAFENLI